MSRPAKTGMTMSTGGGGGRRAALRRGTQAATGAEISRRSAPMSVAAASPVSGYSLAGTAMAARAASRVARGHSGLP